MERRCRRQRRILKKSSKKIYAAGCLWVSGGVLYVCMVYAMARRP